MGLNIFTIFVVSGIVSILFGEALRFGFRPALTAFAAVELIAAIAAIPLFRSETPRVLPAGSEAKSIEIGELNSSK